MRIAKYFILLILLFIATVSIFILTKNGSYQVKYNKIINISKNNVYSYLKNTKNWENLHPWKENKFKILKVTPLNNQLLSYTVLINNKKHEMEIAFHDTLHKKTNVIWTTKGTLSFEDKLLNSIGKGVKNDFKTKFEQTLQYSNDALEKEYNYYTIKLDGFIKKDTLYYIQIPVVSTLENIKKNIIKTIPKLKSVLSNTNTPIIGSPFLIYHQKDSIKNKYNYSIALATKNKVFLSSDSDIMNGQINPCYILKATLTGNYIHLNKVYPYLHKSMDKSNLERDFKFKELQILNTNPITDKLASKWVSEIYYPVKIKKKTLKIIKPPLKKDSSVAK